MVSFHLSDPEVTVAWGPECPRCGGVKYNIVPIHSGKSRRADCANCRHSHFPVWYEDGHLVEQVELQRANQTAVTAGYVSAAVHWLTNATSYTVTASRQHPDSLVLGIDGKEQSCQLFELRDGVQPAPLIPATTPLIVKIPDAILRDCHGLLAFHVSAAWLIPLPLRNLPRWQVVDTDKVGRTFRITDYHCITVHDAFIQSIIRHKQVE